VKFFILPFTGDKETGLIPKIAGIFPKILVSEEIGETCGYGHDYWRRQFLRPAFRFALAFRVKLKFPEAA
jgi:hypothetical protein